MRSRTIGAHYYVPNTYRINAPAKMDENEAELTSDLLFVEFGEVFQSMVS